MTTPLTTKQKILKEGRALLQRHGYNGFSFQDIADKIQIKKPSLYDHFESKDALTISIIQNYSELFDRWNETLAGLNALEKIRRVFDVYYSFTSDKHKICPILALSSDFQELSSGVQKEMQIFLKKWFDWLELQVKEGQKQKLIRRDLKPQGLAQYIYSQGIGSQVQARMLNQPELTLKAGDLIVEMLKES